MAKVTITIEDDGKSLEVNTYFVPRMPLSYEEMTNAQQLATHMLQWLKSQGKLVLESVDGRAPNAQR